MNNSNIINYMMDNIDFPGVNGITNLGNTCYMNSVLQCLSATDIFNHYIRAINFKDDLREGIKRLYIDKQKKKNKDISTLELPHNIIKSKFKDSITYRLYQLFTIMWNCKTSYSPKYFKSAVDSHCNTFKGFNQHDAQEFLNAIIDRIHEELKSNIIVDKYNFNGEFIKYIETKVKLFTKLNNDNLDNNDKLKVQTLLNNLINENINKEIYLNGIDKKINFLKKNHSIISDLFVGMYLGKIVCSTCNYISFLYEPFNMLTLEIADNQLNLYKSLEQCIDNFLKTEEVEYTCDKCKNKTTATKKLSIFNMPEKLIIHFKRFKFINGRTAKLNNLIKFPIENVYFNEFQDIHNNGDKIPFELYGVIHHYGGTNGGHYVATTKNSINFKWYEYNDSNVNIIKDINKVIDRSAYILFYQKKRLDKPFYNHENSDND